MTGLNPKDIPQKEKYVCKMTGKDKIRYRCPQCNDITNYVEGETDQRLNMRYFCTKCPFATNKIGKI